MSIVEPRWPVVRAAAWPTAIAAIVGAVWWKTTQFDFTNLDDDLNLLANPHFRGTSPDHLEWMFTTRWMGHYQPLTWLSYGFDFVRGGLDPRAFHTTNLVLHVLAALAVFALARELLRGLSRASGEALNAAAAVAALSFALHPLRAEPVAWVSGRNDLLAMPLLLLAALLWWRRPQAHGWSRKRAVLGGGAAILSALAAVAALLALDLPGEGSLALTVRSPLLLIAAAAFWVTAVALAALGGGGASYAGACAALLLSSLAKEGAVVAPAVFVLLDGLRLRNRPPATRGAWANVAVELSPLIASSLVVAVLATWARSIPGDVPVEWGERSLGEVIAQAALALVFVPWKTLVPVDLTPIHDFTGRILPSAPLVLLAFGSIAAVATGLCVLRKRAAPVVAAVAAFVVLALPTLGIVRFGTQWVGERYSYVSAVPLHLLLGAAWLLWRRREQPDTPWARAAAILVLALCARQSLQRAEAWRDSERLWIAALEVEETPRALVNLATVYHGRAARGGPASDALQNHAMQLAERALVVAEEQQRPRAEYHRIHGMVLQGAGRFGEAIDAYQRFLVHRPNDVEVHFHRALCMIGLGRNQEAYEAATQLIRLAPDHDLTLRLNELLSTPQQR